MDRTNLVHSLQSVPAYFAKLGSGSFEGDPCLQQLKWWSWHRVDAGKVELDATRYLNFRLPFTVTQLVWVEAILVGTAEIYRNSELDPSKRIYPGALFTCIQLPCNLCHCLCLQIYTTLHLILKS